jgi:PAS domain S-box-containing protein
MRNTSERGLKEVVNRVVRDMPALSVWVRRLGYYGLALLLVAAAATLRWMLPGVLGSTRLLVFNLAWVGAAAFGGLGPGLLATVASWLCVELLFDFTPGRAFLDDPTALARLMILMAGGLTVSLIAERMRRGRIREREQEQALRESEERYHRLFEDDLTGDCISAPEGRILLCNPAFAEMFGFSSAQEAVGTSILDLYIDPRERELLLERLKQERKIGRFGVWRKRHDGEPIHVVENLVGHFNEQGELDEIKGYLFEDTERKRAEEALRESEERLRQRAEEVETLMDLVPVGIWVAHDPQCNHIVGNQTANRLYEAHDHENVSANVSLVRRFCRDGQELKPEELPMQEAAAKNIDVRDAEVDVLLRSDTWRNMLGSASPLHDAEGRVRGCISAFMDITARKQAEQALRERMKELGCLYAVSRDMQEDLSIDELCRRAVEHLVPALQFPEITVAVIELNGKRFTSKNYAEGLSHGLHAPIRVEGEVLGHLTVYYAQERPFIIPEEQNLVNGVAEALSMWLVRKRAEERLRRSERQFKSTFENAAIGIAHVALDGHILQFNSRFCEIAGYRCDDILGKTCEEITFADDWKAEKEQLRRLLDGELPHYSIEKRYIRMDGSPVWVNLTRSVQRNDAGKPEYFIVLVEDISERKRVEEALRELTATLESRVAERTAELKRRARQLQKLTLDMSEAEDRERQRLAEILHDDLQQVLAAAKFHLSLMRNQARSDPSLHMMGEEVDRMLKEAIEKSRSLSHELSPAVMRQKDLAETLEWLANQVQAKHGLVVHVHAHDQIRLESDATKTFLYKVTQELLFNVVKHARVNEARIRVRQMGRCIYLSVSDRGRGFDPQEVGDTAGFGLLSIRERIELLGGRMKIRSVKGKGSTFFITVPDGQVEPELDGRAQSEDINRLRVLLADDHEIVRDGLASLLGEEPGVEVIGGAANGREAVDLADRLEPDVVIMDVSMPLMSGDEATRQIKQRLPNTRVVALSMSEDPDTAERMHAAGAEAYVLKTAPSEELLAAIRGR